MVGREWKKELNRTFNSYNSRSGNSVPIMSLEYIILTVVSHHT